MQKMTPLDVIRLGDPATTAALNATQKVVRDRDRARGLLGAGPGLAGPASGPVAGRATGRGGREAASAGADARQPGFRHLTGRQP